MVFDYNDGVMNPDAPEEVSARIAALERALAEQRSLLKDADARFRSIFDDSPLPLFTYDRNGVLLRYNGAMRALLALPAAGGAPSLTFSSVVQEGYAQRVAGVIQAVFSGQGITDIHWEIPAGIGARRYLSLSTFPVLEAEGRVVFGVAIVLDITEKKRLEQALIQTEKMAALGTLASGLAHEVGTPMNVILGRAESLLKHTGEEKTARGLKIIIAQIDRMTRLIQQLLTFARRKPLERKRIRVNKILEDSLALVEAPISPISIQRHLDPSLPEIWGDADQLLQVFVNLLMNALDSLAEGGRIEVSTRRVQIERRKTVRPGSHLGGKHMVEIGMRDTGCGIESVHLHQIFDPFFTTKPVGKGTGLGLSVAQSIIRDHDGKIHLTSAVGQGTHVRILLPLGEVSPQPPQTALE